MIVANGAIWCLFIGSALFSSAHSRDTNPNELIFAHVIYRHGNRTIFLTHENDPYKNASYWPKGSRYSPDKVYIRSTDIDRAIMSALCNAAGMFPPTKREAWKKSMNWQPIPIHTIPAHEDYLLFQPSPCERLDESWNEYIKLTEPILLESHKEFREYIQKHSGTKIDGLIDFFKFHDSFHIEHMRGLKLPDWAKEVYKNGTLENLAAHLVASYTQTTEMKKARAGFLIKEMLDRFKSKSSSLLKPDRSLWIYSAHDVAIVCVLNALNVYQPHMPNFGASLHFELYKHRQEYYVQLFYRNDKSEKLSPIEIPNCGFKCPLDKFYELYKDILIAENETYESLCRIHE